VVRHSIFSGPHTRSAKIFKSELCEVRFYHIELLALDKVHSHRHNLLKPYVCTIKMLLFICFTIELEVMALR